MFAELYPRTCKARTFGSKPVEKEVPLKPPLLITLYRLAELVSLCDDKMHTTTGLAERLDVSQQTASRHLINLEKGGYIRREKQTRGEAIRITEKGRSELQKMYATLERITRPSRREIILEGEVFSGLREGAYYISQLGYGEQFRKKLGFKPFPGTLNLKLDERSAEKRGSLEAYPSVVIESFDNERRTFGSVRCYKVILNGRAEAYLITAYRTHYGSDVVEIISPENLRELLGIRDGDRVTITALLSSDPR